MLLQELLWRIEVLTAQFPRILVLWDIMLYHLVNYPYSLKECSASTFSVKRSQQKGWDLLTTEDGNTSFLQNTVLCPRRPKHPAAVVSHSAVRYAATHFSLKQSHLHTTLIWTVPALPGTLHTNWCPGDKHGTWQRTANRQVLLCRNMSSWMPVHSNHIRGPQRTSCITLLLSKSQRMHRQ